MTDQEELLNRLDRWKIKQEFSVNDIGQIIRDCTTSAAEIRRLQDALNATYTRLEANFYIDGNGNRVACEVGSIPDGIACRDETIKQLDSALEAARKTIKELDPYNRGVVKQSEDF